MTIDSVAYAAAEDALARLLDTRRDVTILQGEAILVLEAVARSLGGPGVRALNLVSGPYGEALGEWLARGGGEVDHLRVDFDRAISTQAVRDALGSQHYDLVSVVHAEAATGVVNPLEDIAAAAHEGGALVVVDAVASVGAEPLNIDAWDLDLVMLGPQKALAGPAGVCALVASQRGWQAMAANRAAPRESILSLLDWKERWIDRGRRQLPGYAYQHEMAALGVALGRLIDDVGLSKVVDRHRRAAAAVRAAADALGLEAWVPVPAETAGVVTLLRPPAGLSPAEVIDASTAWMDDAALITAAPGPLADRAVRINHTGRGASPASVLSAVVALGLGLAELGQTPQLGEALRLASGHLV